MCSIELETHLFPITIPVSVPDRLNALNPEKVLTVDAGSCHGGSAILKEPDDIDTLWNLTKPEDQVDLGMDLVVCVLAVTVTSLELGSPTAHRVDTDWSFL